MDLNALAKLENAQNSNRKRTLATENNNEVKCEKIPKLEETTKDEPAESLQISPAIHNSPRKRLQVSQPKATNRQKNEKFIYGNYSQYYGYRNKDKDFHDIRLDVFEKYAAIFKGKQVLDIGCNSGFITMEVAKRFHVKHITGLDIDRNLIKQATSQLHRQRNLSKATPRNISFLHANYVLRDPVLLEIEHEQFDVIMCLSITKWIHLNFGDQGLKQAFRRMFLQLRPGGKLILEAQPFDNYNRRKKMNDTIHANYKAIKFLPKDFTDYLLSPEVGFSSVELMGVPQHCANGFKRPIQIFTKGKTL